MDFTRLPLLSTEATWPLVLVLGDRVSGDSRGVDGVAWGYIDMPESKRERR